MGDCAVGRYNAEFSAWMYQHHGFLPGKSDFHNYDVKREIIKKWVKQPLNNFKLSSLVPLLKVVTIVLYSVWWLSALPLNASKKRCGAHEAGCVFPHFLFFSCSFGFRITAVEGKLEFLMLCFFSRSSNCLFSSNPVI